MAEPDWRSVIDPGRLAHWMTGAGLGDGTISRAELLTGGTQNLLLRFEHGGRQFVLRRPSANARPEANRTIGREATVLAALANTAVPHPRLIAVSLEPGAAMDTAFYLMEPIDGFNPAVEMPALHRSDPAMRRKMGFDLVKGLATLAAVDPVAVGLERFGKIDGFLDRQAGRWLSQFEGYAMFPAWVGHLDLSAVPTVGQWLDRNRPARFKPGILHGDFHLANVMYKRDAPELVAIIDWEMATIGPPLLDLGWLLATWPDPGDRDDAQPLVTPWEGFPTTAELVERYHELSGADLADFAWYRVLACYKFAIVLEGSHARATAGLASQETGLALHRRAVNLLDRAIRYMHAR